ncbi:MAG: cadherin domain-containing protein [Pseudomonadota bacterium]
MTKRNSQANTVVVPAVHAVTVDGKAVATKSVVVPAEAEAAAAKADVKADEALTTTVQPVAALVAPAPMAMVAEPVAAAEPAAAAQTTSSDDDDDTDLTPYIVGGVLILGGILAVALSSGDTDPIPVTPAPANTAPSFTSALTATVAENAPVATIVYDANAADTQGNAIVFTIGGTDAALFNIDAATGVVTLRSSANFEAKPSYSFTVTATDNGTPALSATQTITVTVSNVNEAPTFTSATATATTPENIPTTTTVFTAAAVDVDAGTTLIYSISGADAGAFNINSGTGAVTFRASPDFEAKSSYTFVVTAADAATGGLTATQTVTINVTDVAEGPVFTSGATATVAENAAASTVVFDANAAGATAFALSGADAAAFNFDTATGVATLRTPADFETKATYNVTVTATGAGGTTTQNVAVAVTNVNEAPVITSSTTAAAIGENQTGVAVYTATATDPEGNGITYSLGTGGDNGLFSINATNGTVTLNASPDFETKATYTFTVVATDNASPALSSSRTVTLPILNVNEAPIITSPTTAAAISENAGPNAAVYTVAAIDRDAGSAVTYSLGTGGDNGFFSINPVNGTVSLINAANFEAKSSYTFTVIATDNGNPALTASRVLTLAVNDVNENPVITSPTTATVAENAPVGTVVYTAAATDVDSDTILTYSLGGADAGLLNINAVTGAVTLRTSANFEAKSVYNFTVTATDDDVPSLTAVRAVTLNVANINETPTFATASQTVNFGENGTGVVLIAAATDQDGTAAPNTLTYSLTGADAALFNVSTTGVVTFRANPDFETPRSAANSNVYSFNVVATDQGGLSATQVATVNVTNVNETPTFATAPQSVTFAENGAGTVLTASAIDPDGAAAPNTLTYTLAGADAALFNVSPTGVVTFRAAPDFETPRSSTNSNVYNVNVVATDQGGLAVTQAAIVTVTDVNEGVRIDGPGIPAGTNTGFNAAVGNVTYLESGSAGNITTISNFTAGDIIQTDVATSSYSFGSVGSDLTISFLNNGVSTQITLAGAAGNNFIFNEATAEQAVGFDFFRSTATPPPPAANTLSGTTTYNAANAGVTYTDDAQTPNISTITNFTSDDRVVAINANGGSYSFGSVGSDLVISFLTNGVSSQITLVGAANPNVFVFNEATAEQAVGFDFFRYG